MTRGKKWLLSFLVLLLLISWFISFHCLRAADRFYMQAIEIVDHAKGFTEQELQNMVDLRNEKDQNVPRYTAWTQKDDLVLENKELQKTWKGKVLFYTGENDRFFSNITEDSCALTKEAAYELFGSYDVIGEMIQIGGKEYLVERMVVNDMMGNGMTVICKDAGLEYDRLHVNTQGVQQEIAALAFQYADHLWIDYDFLLKLLKKISLWPFWLMTIIVAVRLWKKITDKGKGKGRLRWLLLLIIIGIVGGIVGLLLGAPLILPDSLIPTKWSDFEFWSRAGERMAMQIDHFLTMKVYVVDELMRKTMLSIIVHGFLQSLLLLLLCKEGIDYGRKYGEKYGRQFKRRVRRYGRACIVRYRKNLRQRRGSSGSVPFKDS